MLSHLEVPFYVQPAYMTVRNRCILPSSISSSGEWFLDLTLAPASPESAEIKADFSVDWKGATGRINARAVYLKHVDSPCDGTRGTELAGPFPPTDDGTLSAQEMIRSIDWRHPLTLRLHLCVETSDDDCRGKKGDARKAAKLYSTYLRAKHPNDTRFTFPGIEGRDLWASSAVLADFSPYFRSLFSSGFAEEAATTGMEIERASKDASLAEVEAVEVGFEDSDDETDRRRTVGKDPEEAQSHPDGQCSAPFHHVKVKSTAYTTYHSVLCWILTSHITFAPLLSSFRPTSSGELSKANEARSSAISLLARKHPSLPHPTSPKSVYRLAHFLELPELQKLALLAIKSQITTQNVAYELFGDVSGCYPEVREMYLDYAIKHWAEVKESVAMKEVGKAIEADELPHAAAISYQLAMRF